MIRLEPAREEQFETLLELVYHQQAAYLNPVLDLVQLTWDQFGAYFRHTGQVYAMLDGKELVGLCWVQFHGRTLYLHGIIVRDECQGLGYGTQALRRLEELYAGRMDAIELAVHASNPRARALYQRLGYCPLRFERESGFFILRKPLPQFQGASHGSVKVRS